MPEVEVATAVSDEGFEPQFYVAAELMKRSQPDVAWSDRPRVLVEVQDSTRLQEILRRAGKVFGFNPVLGDPSDGEFSYICKFYTGDKAEPVYFNTVIDRQGVITNYVDPMKATYGQIAAAAEAGVFLGDPARLLLLVDDRQQWGGNGFVFWENLIKALPEALLYIGGVYGGVRAVTDAASAGLRVIRKVREKWYKRGVHLSDIKRVIARPRTVKEAAGLLGISKSDTEKLLRALALEPSSDARWRPRTDVDAEVLRLIFDSAEQASEMYLDGDTLRIALKQVLALPPDERLNQVANVFASVAEEKWSSSREEEER
jgi:hypothetical protein